MTTMEIILVTLVAAICGMGSVLDERQTHRPLVACTLIGLVLGNLETGIIVGGTLELVALGWIERRCGNGTGCSISQCDCNYPRHQRRPR